MTTRGRGVIRVTTSVVVLVTRRYIVIITRTQPTRRPRPGRPTEWNR
jgi:hypothetical protein